MEKKSFDKNAYSTMIINNSSNNLNNNSLMNNNINDNINNNKNNNNKTFINHGNQNSKILKENNYYFDKNHKNIVRYPKNFFKKTPEKQSRTKVSVSAPEWMKVVTDEKNAMYNEIMCKNEETLSIFSRYNKWITVTPRSKNRKRPLEKMKIEKMDETSKIMPNWMQIKVKKDMDLYGMFKSVEYNSIRHVGNIFICFFSYFLFSKQGKNTVVLVDKNTNNPKDTLNNPNKSIYNIGDYRHNLVMKEDADKYSSSINQKPKQFLAWDDGKRFNERLKKDK